jgi:hypothetical protein
MPMVWRVTELDPGRSFTWSTTSPGQTTEATHQVRSMGAGTSEVVLSLDQTGAFASVFGVAFRRMTRRYLRMEADGLAQFVGHSV